MPVAIEEGRKEREGHPRQLLLVDKLSIRSMSDLVHVGVENMISPLRFSVLGSFRFSSTLEVEARGCCCCF